VQLLTTNFPEDPALDAALSSALVRRAARAPETPAVVRIFVPTRTLSFGRLDAIRPGFAAAVVAARTHGFTPVVRGAGGRAAAYNEHTLVLETVSPDSEGMAGLRPRFQRMAASIVAVLRDLGADARIGPVPGEYCPGDWTVNGGGRVKLAGTAQRFVKGAWLFGAELVVADPQPVRAVLTDVNAALGMEFDPRTAASLVDLIPGVSLEQVRSAFITSLGKTVELAMNSELEVEARSLRHHHAVEEHGVGEMP